MALVVEVVGTYALKWVLREDWGDGCLGWGHLVTMRAIGSGCLYVIGDARPKDGCFSFRYHAWLMYPGEQRVRPIGTTASERVAQSL